MDIKLIGKILRTLGYGLLFAAYMMDTTVDSGAGRVHNIGLLSQQQTLYLLGALSLIAGIFVYVLSKNELKKDPTEADSEANRENNELENRKAADEALYIESGEKSDDRITGLDLTIFWGAIILGVLLCDSFPLWIGGSLILLSFIFLGNKLSLYQKQIISEMKVAKNKSIASSEGKS